MLCTSSPFHSGQNTALVAQICRINSEYAKRTIQCLPNEKLYKFFYVIFPNVDLSRDCAPNDNQNSFLPVRCTIVALFHYDLLMSILSRKRQALGVCYNYYVSFSGTPHLSLIRCRRQKLHQILQIHFKHFLHNAFRQTQPKQERI